MRPSMNSVGPGELELIFFGGYDPDYPRNSIIRKGWTKIGLPVSQCRAEKRWKVHRRYPALAWKYLKRASPGRLLFVPDFRHKDVPLAWLLARLYGKRLIFDPLVSRYETRVLDRGDAEEGSMQSWHNRNIDRVSLGLPDLVLADTQAHARFFVDQFNVPADKVGTLHIGFDEDLFGECPFREGEGELRVLFYGTYLPLHGIDAIVDAASILRDSRVHFTLVGGGQTFTEMRKRASSIADGKIDFIPAVPVGELEPLISGADVVLGIFGLTPKADMVIPNKVFQALASGRAVITADTSAVRELFQNGEHLLTVPPGDAHALAAGLETLRGNPELRRRIAVSGCKFVREGYNSAAVAGRFLALLKEMKLL